MLLTSFGWHLNDGLSVGQIICIVFFTILMVALILITVGFWIYRQQLKKISKIDQSLEILYRYPLAEGINRLNKVNVRNNHQFDELYRLIRIKYLTVLDEVFNVAAKQFLAGLDSKEFTKLSYRSLKRLRFIEQAVDKARIEFDTLHGLLNDFFSYEYALRDDMIELKNQVSLIKTNFSNSQDLSQYKFPENTFNDYLAYIYQSLNNTHALLTAGDYFAAHEKFAKTVALTVRLNEEIVLYPKIRHFLSEGLANEMLQIEKDWVGDSLSLTRAKTRFKTLKEHTFNESKFAFDCLKDLNFHEAKDAIRNIETEIYEFKSELVYEEEIKSFFKFKGSDIISTMQVIQKWTDTLGSEHSPEFRQNEKLIYENLIKTSQRIVNNIEKIDHVGERELANLKNSTRNDLTKIDRYIYLLNLIKSNNTKLEQQFLAYLNLTFEIKANLIVANNILKDSRRWLKEDLFKADWNDFHQVYDELARDEVSNIKQFTGKYPHEIDRVAAIERLKKVKNYSYKLKSAVVYQYQLYYLTVALLPILEFSQNESKIHYIYQDMVKSIDNRDYEKAIDQFVNQLSTVYYQL